MVKRIASARAVRLAVVSFMLMAACGAVCQDVNQALPDAPSAVVANQAHTLNDLVEEARTPLKVEEADVHAGMVRQGLGVTETTASRQEDFDARLHRILYPASIKPESNDRSADSGSAVVRGARAAFHVLIARDDSGSAKLNSAYLLRTLTAVAADAGSTPYWRRHAGDPFSDFGAMVGNDAGLKLWREFEPNIGHVVIRHTPKFVSRIQGRIGHK